MKWFKETIRRIMWLGPSEYVAKPGTLWFRFLDWLYENGEPVTDGWEYPDESQRGRR